MKGLCWVLRYYYGTNQANPNPNPDPIPDPNPIPIPNLNPNPNPNPSPSPNPKPKPNLVHDGLQRAVGAHEVAWVGAQVGIARGADLALAEVAHDARAAEGVQALNDGACSRGGARG